MFETPHPEVLARDWLPPVAMGREVEVVELVRRLDAPAPRAPPPWIAAVTGARGSGTSTVARRAARAVADTLRTVPGSGPPRVVVARTLGLRGTHGVASALLRHLDEGFDGQGFSVVEILAGFLRRLRREGRPTVLVLDDLGVGGPDLGPVLRALGDPDRFLPEGENGIPPTWTILAGTPDGVRAAEASLAGRYPLGRPVVLGPYLGPRALATRARPGGTRTGSPRPARARRPRRHPGRGGRSQRRARPRPVAPRTAGESALGSGASPAGLAFVSRRGRTPRRPGDRVGRAGSGGAGGGGPSVGSRARRRGRLPTVAGHDPLAADRSSRTGRVPSTGDPPGRDGGNAFGRTRAPPRGRMGHVGSSDGYSSSRRVVGFRALDGDAGTGSGGEVSGAGSPSSFRPS